VIKEFFAASTPDITGIDRHI